MASSRIFIKGLPPTISEDEFKKHFSAKHEITDAKLISHRRIGYVGYKTPEDAAKAVKYFNRSFIRMSKIGVEIARPVSNSIDLELAATDLFRYLMRLYPCRGRHRENWTGRMAR
jgi:multiple RNA-binding domain-containing protein 1